MNVNVGKGGDPGGVCFKYFLERAIEAGQYLVDWCEGNDLG